MLQCQLLPMRLPSVGEFVAALWLLSWLDISDGLILLDISDGLTLLDISDGSCLSCWAKEHCQCAGLLAAGAVPAVVARCAAVLGDPDESVERHRHDDVAFTVTYDSCTYNKGHNEEWRPLPLPLPRLLRARAVVVSPADLLADLALDLVHQQPVLLVDLAGNSQ